MHQRTLSTALTGLLLVGLTALPGSPAQAATATATSTSARASLTTAQFETQLLTLVNNRRKAIGCVVLRSNSYLISAARAHTRRMASAARLSHQLPGEAGLAKRIVNAGYTGWTAAAENLAWGAGTPGAVYKMWMNSSGHRANIQRCTYRDAGIGVVYSGGRPWVTLDLGRRR